MKEIGILIVTPTKMEMDELDWDLKIKKPSPIRSYKLSVKLNYVGRKIAQQKSYLSKD